MNCDELANNLTSFLEGDLAPETEVAALEHLAGCSQCELVLAETRELIGLARDHARVAPREADRRRMRAKLGDALGGSTSSGPQ